MIKGIGIDIIELDRIKQNMERHTRFLERVLTEKERELFDQLSSPTRKLEFLAGRFTAKEAYAKAVGTGIGKLRFIDIEILPNEKGAPIITVVNSEDEKIAVSISHSKEYAVAQVVIDS
ncbi:holo-ACP synthase [Aquibacillus sp. 3ASR75-11]|uniref:Holo-[acyl-carrier-protein] synthase n=1 Tax=Terrihalobacillus insolitus TaxID=2950438 RepID=A0A9X3WSK0_9BACI|nr:holo-ACP synthase [Terrihalobacillus insolitus]MDC3413126.1 holo-ACP synthase [Terrihalobacillus insolitus]MDC3425202.1 holo-ACP synthase [Terrihalobacillus insolitus]